jgi:hypothetical protein
MANPASPLPALVEIGVGSVVRVAGWAFDPLRGFGSLHVLGVGYRLKMGWVHAGVDTAKMVQLEPVRDGANEQFVYLSVRVPASRVV